MNYDLISQTTNTMLFPLKKDLFHSSSLFQRNQLEMEFFLLTSLKNFHFLSFSHLLKVHLGNTHNFLIHWIELDPKFFLKNQYHQSNIYFHTSKCFLAWCLSAKPYYKITQLILKLNLMLFLIFLTHLISLIDC